MQAGIGRPGAEGLIDRLRGLSPSWETSERQARQIAEKQARVLLAEAGVAAPPVPSEIVGGLEGVHIHQLPETTVAQLLSASQATASGGDILVDGALPRTEQRLALFHELKHIIDGGHTTSAPREPGSAVCAEFALAVLMPAAWVHADWKSGERDPIALAERYDVPIEAVEQRLCSLRLITRRPRRCQPIACQWHISGPTQQRRRTSVAIGAT